jgi:hypothetical protein
MMNPTRPIGFAVALVLASAGCSSIGGSADDAAPTTSAPPAAAGTVPTGPDPEREPGADRWTDEEQEAIDAFDSYREAFTEAAGVPDPDASALDDWATGTQLTADRDVLRKLAQAGQSIAPAEGGESQVEPVAAQVAGDGATVTVCEVADLELHRRDGSVANTQRETYRKRVSLSRASGSWKVTEVKGQKWAGTDIEQCRRAG